MENLRNSECWYINSCKEDCDRCVTFTELKWQMNNSGLYPAQQKIIELYIDNSNSADRQAYKTLSNIRKHITDFVDGDYWTISDVSPAAFVPRNQIEPFSVKVIGWSL